MFALCNLRVIVLDSECMNVPDVKHTVTHGFVTTEVMDETPKTSLRLPVCTLWLH